MCYFFGKHTRFVFMIGLLLMAYYVVSEYIFPLMIVSCSCDISLLIMHMPLLAMHMFSLRLWEFIDEPSYGSGRINASSLCSIVWYFLFHVRYFLFHARYFLFHHRPLSDSILFHVRYFLKR